MHAHADGLTIAHRAWPIRYVGGDGTRWNSSEQRERSQHWRRLWPAAVGPRTAYVPSIGPGEGACDNIRAETVIWHVLHGDGRRVLHDGEGGQGQQARRPRPQHRRPGWSPRDGLCTIRYVNGRLRGVSGGGSAERTHHEGALDFLRSLLAARPPLTRTLGVSTTFRF